MLRICAPLSDLNLFKHNYQMLGWEGHKLPYVKPDTSYDSLLFFVTDFYKISAWQVWYPKSLKLGAWDVTPKEVM